MGQKGLASRHDSQDRRRWGRLGGRPRKKRYMGAGTKQLEGREGEPARVPVPSSAAGDNVGCQDTPVLPAPVDSLR